MPMWNTLRRLIQRPTEPVPPAASEPERALPQAPTGAPAPTAPHVADTHESALDLRFSTWLLDLPCGDPNAHMSAAEQRVLAQLDTLMGAPSASPMVPRLPAALPRLMALVRREDVSARALAEHLAADPALVGELVRLANSPRYRPSREISSLEQAVQVLGQDGLSQLVSRAMLGPVFSAQPGRFGREATSRLWELADRCAHGGAFLRQAHEDRFDAYLAGMAAQTGLLAALRVLEQQHRQAPTASASPDFHAGLAERAARLSARIARDWAFPADAIQALELRASHAPALTGGLAAAVMAAERSAKRQLLGLPPESLPAEDEAACLGELQRLFGGSDKPA